MMRIACLLSACWLAAAAAMAPAQDAAAIKAQADYLKQGDGKAAEALAKFGAAAVPALLDVLKEGDAFAKGHAMRALGLIGPDAKQATTALAAELGSDSVAH